MSRSYASLAEVEDVLAEVEMLTAGRRGPVLVRVLSGRRRSRGSARGSIYPLRVACARYRSWAVSAPPGWPQGSAVSRTYAAWGVGWNSSRTRFCVGRSVYEDGKWADYEQAKDRAGRRLCFRRLETAEAHKASLRAPLESDPAFRGYPTTA